MKRNSDYNKFREALRLDFSDMPPKSKEELGSLMRISGYHKVYNQKAKKTYKEEPNKAQLDYAWDYLKSIGKAVPHTQKQSWVTETYRYHVVRRAVKDVTIRGKTYRKGQFLPKRR